jgi:hypothetical protein
VSPARLALALGLAAAGPAAAFERVTVVDGDPSSACLWWGRASEPRWAPPQAAWPGPRGPIWQLSTAHLPAACGGLEAVRGVVRQAFAQWSGATRAGEAEPCTGFAPSEGEPTPAVAIGHDGANLVVFRAGDCADLAPPGAPCLTEGGCGNLYNCWESESCTAASCAHLPTVLALTWNTMDLETGEILDSDVELQDWNGSATGPTGWVFTCAPADWTGAAPTCPAGSPWSAPGCVWADVGNTLTHEAGHVAGLDHLGGAPCVEPVASRPTMCPSAPPGTLWMRTLSADEVEGVCAIYPRAAATVTCVAPPSACGCGGGEASWPALVALGLLGLRRGTGPRATDRRGRGPGPAEGRRRAGPRPGGGPARR